MLIPMNLVLFRRRAVFDKRSILTFCESEFLESVNASVSWCMTTNIIGLNEKVIKYFFFRRKICKHRSYYIIYLRTLENAKKY